MTSNDQDVETTDQVLYLTTLRCSECGNGTTFAHRGPDVAQDQSPPWPDDVLLCPECGTYYPDDLGVSVEEIHVAEIVPPEEERLATDGGREHSGTSLCWDGHSCPIGGCDGELQQQDRFNVLCLECETVWTHYVTDEEHILSRPDQQHEFTKPRAETDGGREQSGDRIDRGCPNCGCEKTETDRGWPSDQASETLREQCAGCGYPLGVIR